MANSDSENRNFVERHRFKMQSFAFVAMLVLPFLLYFAAQAGDGFTVKALVGLMALVMLVVVFIC